MARALGTFRASDQSFAVAPNQSVLILNADGSAFAQTLYVGPTGGETLVNPLVSDDVGLIVAYVDTPQRAIARVVIDGTTYDTPFDFADDPVDLLSSPFAVAGLTPGAANQGLLTNAAGTLTVWGASPQSLMTSTGDLLVASAANTPARLAIGSARQSLQVNSSGTGLAYGASLSSLLTATGDLPYASSANTPARLAAGVDGRVLTLASGLPSWVAPSFSITANGANLLANGSMSIAQRNPVVAVNATSTDLTYQVCDRWKTLQNTGTAWILQLTGTAATGMSPYAFRFLSQGNSAKGGLIQILENVETYPLRGQTVSLQARFYTQAAITDLRMAILSWTGAADTVTDPVSAWNAAGTNPTLAANWAYVNTPANLSIPATTWTQATLNAQTVPAGCVNLAVMAWCEDITQTSLSDHWDITMIQLELGSTATAFQRPSLADELARCQRYYYKTFPQGTAPAQNSGVLSGAVAYVVQVAGTGGPYGVMHHYPTTMRSSGAVTFYNPAAANGKWRNTSAVTDSGTPSGVASDNGAFLYNAQVVGDAVGNQVYVHLTTDADL